LHGKRIETEDGIVLRNPIFSLPFTREILNIGGDSSISKAGDISMQNKTLKKLNFKYIVYHRGFVRDNFKISFDTILKKNFGEPIKVYEKDQIWLYEIN